MTDRMYVPPQRRRLPAMNGRDALPRPFIIVRRIPRTVLPRTVRHPTNPSASTHCEPDQIVMSFFLPRSRDGRSSPRVQARPDDMPKPGKKKKKRASRSRAVRRHLRYARKGDTENVVETSHLEADVAATRIPLARLHQRLDACLHCTVLHLIFFFFFFPSRALSNQACFFFFLPLSSGPSRHPLPPSPATHARVRR